MCIRDRFSIHDFENGSNEAFMALSEGIRNIILRSKELENMNTDLGDENKGADIGDIPF